MYGASRVYLVGAGPGDPELLTVKAHRLLQEADVVVYDRLVSRPILALVPPGTKLIYVGKRPGAHHLPQREINQLLVDMAQTYRKVVRLKGGDPFIFGRGSEEAETLIANDIEFEVVPGITAAAGCGAATGIPLSHRGLATSIHFVTGHCRADQALDVDWRAMAGAKTTVVFYMGLGNIELIKETLIAHGRDPQTPAAVIERGTTPSQRELFTTLAQLPEDLARENFKPPCLVIIGQVVEVGKQLNAHLNNPGDQLYEMLA